MGLYWWSALYFGRLISTASRTRILNSQLVKDNPGIVERTMCSHLVDHGTGKWILHLPGHFQKIGGINQVLQMHKIHAGKVEWAEVTPWADKWTKKVDRPEIETLKQLIRTGDPATYEKDKLRAGWYVYQGQWSTMGGTEDEMSKIYMEANVPVVGCPLETYSDV